MLRHLRWRHARALAAHQDTQQQRRGARIGGGERGRFSGLSRCFSVYHHESIWINNLISGIDHRVIGSYSRIYRLSQRGNVKLRSLRHLIFIHDFFIPDSRQEDLDTFCHSMEQKNNQIRLLQWYTVALLVPVVSIRSLLWELYHWMTHSDGAVTSQWVLLMDTDRWLFLLSANLEWQFLTYLFLMITIWLFNIAMENQNF